jgi:drug/metabolite transporter (DMT)-like permease
MAYLTHQSIACKIISCLCFASINGVVKSLSLPSLQIVAIESLLGALVLWPYCSKLPFSLLKKPLYWMRSSVAFVGMIAWVYSLKALPLFQTVAMGFLSPFITVVGACFCFHEPMTYKRIGAITLATLGGMCLSYGPRLLSIDFSCGDLIYLAPLVATALFALSNLMSKALLEHTTPLALTFSLLATIGVGLLSTFQEWTCPQAGDMIRLVILGILTAIAHFSLHYAMKRSDLTLLLPLGVTRLVAASFIGWFFFNEMPTWWTAYGMILIGAAFFFLKKNPSTS